MDSAKFQAGRGYRLEPPGHPQGASCNAEGASLGPIRLLTKSAAGFAPRPVTELNKVLGQTFGRPVDATGLLSGLDAVARALNEGDLARAMIATTQMRLPYLDEAQALRAARAEALRKAAADDPAHPGWPAGTSGGKGGQFRPKEATEQSIKGALKEKTEEELREHFNRVLIREALRRILTPGRVLRLVGETAANAIPFVNVAADVALAADIASVAADFVELKREADAALDFIKKAPYDLEDLRASKEDKEFSSFEALKKIDLVKFYGPAGDGYQYHHIVEQNAKGDIPIEMINSTRNVIRIPKLLHEEITGEYARRDPDTKVILRDELKGKPFETQRTEGLGILREMGIVE